jgi:hypothetical protein
MQCADAGQGAQSCEMPLGCSDRYGEFLSHLFRRKTVDGKLEHLKLPCGQLH